MASTFSIPSVNSFRWVKRNLVKDPRYHSYSFDDYRDPNCYWAKWQTNDRAQVQLLSDSAPLLQLHDYYTDEVLDDIALPEIDFDVLDVTFKCYEGEVVWGEYGEGDYYLTLSYNDGVDIIVWETSPIECRDEHEQTILLECTNTLNDKGVIFDTGIVFNFRVEGLRDRKFLPKSENQLYTDQIYNVTQENSTTFRNFTIDIGMASGLPNWVIDKINDLFSLDQKKVDGDYYEKADENSQFEPTRSDIGLNEDGWWSINVIPKYNNILGAYKTSSGDDPNSDYIVVRKSEPFLNVAAPFVASGIFKTNSVLDYITITNKGLANFTLRVGTSSGANDIAEEDISPDLTHVVSIRHRFESASDVWISGIDFVALDIWLAYDQLDAKPSAVPVAGGGGFVQNVEYCYREKNDGDFERDWNISTGLGREDTPFFGCAMCDGRNGTINRANEFTIGFDRLNPDLRDSVTGDNEVELTMDQLPADGAGMFINIANNTNGDKPGVNDKVAITSNNGGLGYEMHKANSGQFIGKTANLGEGNPIDNRPLSRVTVLFVKITD